MKMEIGIDLIDHFKFIRFNRENHPRFYTRVFTQDELSYCSGKITRYAGIFAAKEACFKALSGFGTTFLSQFEIIHIDGKPEIKDRFHDNKVGIITIEDRHYWVSLSISHAADQSIAMAMAGAVVK